MSELLTYALEGTTAVVTMDDGKANALSVTMIEALGAALTRAEGEAASVVLAGRAERFCAGFDLKVMSKSMEDATALLATGARLLMRLYGTRLPLVVACTGHALAGGALVVLTGDVRIGAAGPYRLGLNEVSIGLPVPVLAMELARDRLAPNELAHATLGARVYDPEGAVRAGYLDEVAPPGEVLGRAKAEAARLGAYGRGAFAGTKERLRGRTIRHVLEALDADMQALVRGA